LAETVHTMSVYIDSVCPVTDCNTHRPGNVCGVWNGKTSGGDRYHRNLCFSGVDQWRFATMTDQIDACATPKKFWKPQFWFNVQPREVRVGSPAHCSPPCSTLDGGGWTLVRHTAGTGNWGPWSDDLTGTDSWGVADGPRSDNHWTFPWSGETYNQFLFTYGDCSGWLIATRDAVNGAYYDNDKRDIIKSSIRHNAYEALWYNRANHAEDPWISIQDHGVDDSIVYGENGHHALTSKKNAHAGANVYIRNVGI